MMNAPIGLDTHTPNAARMWDYLLGGKDNFEIDRTTADAINKICDDVGVPNGHVVALENRAFIRRAVRFLAEAGVTQFIDIGAGLPTQGNVHQIAHEVNPDARVVYVDYDEMVLSHGRTLLADNVTTKVILGDLRRPLTILTDPELRELINPDEPVAILLVAVLHLLDDNDNPTGIVAQLRDAMAPGSYLALTHSTTYAHPDLAAAVADAFRQLRVTAPLVPRSHAEISAFFAGLDVVPPGVVFPTRWLPDPHDNLDSESRWMYAGVGRVPTTSPDGLMCSGATAAFGDSAPVHMPTGNSTQ